MSKKEISTKEENVVQLDDNLYVNCPIVKFNLRKLKNCLTCDHYRGIFQAAHPIEDEEGNIIHMPSQEEMYQPICAKPLTRKLTRVLED